MSKRNEMPITPPEGDVHAPGESAATETKPPETAIDPKDAARRRSREDIARKRRDLYHKHGKR